MNSKKKLIKNKILSGKGHKTHYNEVAVTPKTHHMRLCFQLKNKFFIRQWRHQTSL